MGRLIYDHFGSSTDIDDRTLAHLQVVMVSKLRRGESFLFTWSNDVSAGSGRIAVWINPHSPLTFRFSGGRAAALNRAWLDVLARSANSPGGLVVVQEPE